MFAIWSKSTSTRSVCKSCALSTSARSPSSPTVPQTSVSCRQRRMASAASGSTVQEVSPSPMPNSKPLRLPRLPVPRLRDSLNKYLTSLEPLLLEDEAQGGDPFDVAMQKRQAWARKFEEGIGETLQERLQELDRNSPHNWLDDNFWLDKAYLEWRAPLLINSNWWLVFNHDENIPRDCLTGADAQSASVSSDIPPGITPWQIRRASWLLSRTLEYKARFETHIDPETTRTGLWLQGAVPRMFNVCRIPRKGRDYLSTKQPNSPHFYKVIVMVHDWVYAINVYESDRHSSYNQAVRLDSREIERRIRGVALDAKKRLALGEQSVPIGILTSDDRDIWASNREHLLSLSTRNAESLQAIEESILVVSLDDVTLTAPQELQSHLHAIRSGVDAKNRWFDKAISLIVDPSTRAGMMGEHAPVDALVPSIVAEFALVQEVPADDPPPADLQWEEADMASSGATCGWERLDFDVDARLLKACGDSKIRARALIVDSDNMVFGFRGFGGNWIKNVARMSPDAFVQMALQLAWYKTHHSFTATYETALTRIFLHGRTETIRTYSQKSRAFVLTMLDSRIPPQEKLGLLQEAIRFHSTLTRDAATGKGVDRHLLGLRLLLKPGELHILFEDELFSRSQDWKLSTSGLTAGPLFRGTGFGAVHPDGYGINYLIGPDGIKFGIESKMTSPLTSTTQFWHAIHLSLSEMFNLVEFRQLEPHFAQAKL